MPCFKNTKKTRKSTLRLRAWELFNGQFSTGIDKITATFMVTRAHAGPVQEATSGMCE